MKCGSRSLCNRDCGQKALSQTPGRESIGRWYWPIPSYRWWIPEEILRNRATSGGFRQQCPFGGVLDLAVTVSAPESSLAKFIRNLQCRGGHRGCTCCILLFQVCFSPKGPSGVWGVRTL